MRHCLLNLPLTLVRRRWADFFGPVERHNGNYSNLRRYNLSEAGNGLGTPIYGYINDTRPQPQSFAAEDIVILSDGFCGSTCAVFAEFMKTQVGVHAIAAGGRSQTGPMQWVGGSKGSNDQELPFLGQIVETAYQYASPAQKTLLEEAANGDYNKTKEDAIQAIRRIGSNNANVNFQNNIRKGDENYTPLQFVYEAADCRFFYTAPMIANQHLVWQHTYNLRWGSGTCVAGSTGQPSSVTGYNSSYFEAAPPTGANNTFGANITYSYPDADTSSTVGPSRSTPAPSSATTEVTNPPPPTISPYTGTASALTVSGVTGAVVAAAMLAML
jgi:hypothetical protein